MAALVHFSKNDGDNARTTNSAVAFELTNYTIAWSDLTAAGFVASDNVVILVGVHVCDPGNANNNNTFAVGFGSTFAVQGGGRYFSAAERGLQ